MQVDLDHTDPAGDAEVGEHVGVDLADHAERGAGGAADGGRAGGVEASVVGGRHQAGTVEAQGVGQGPPQAGGGGGVGPVSGQEHGYHLGLLREPPFGLDPLNRAGAVGGREDRPDLEDVDPVLAAIQVEAHRRQQPRTQRPAPSRRKLGGVTCCTPGSPGATEKPIGVRRPAIRSSSRSVPRRAFARAVRREMVGRTGTWSADSTTVAAVTLAPLTSAASWA